MTKIKTIESLAQEVLDQFERGTRDDGSTYWSRKERQEDWVYEMIMDAHGDFGPDDYIYEAIVEALQALADGDTDGEGIEADIYHSDRLKWLSSHTARVFAVDELRAETGAGDSIMDEIGNAQYQERRDVFDVVKAGLETMLELDDNDDQ
jgi:hypothetical protein